ncbi:MAG TPA: mechanosensitive ion channel family protein, partial [Candidatus Nitrosotalea sp.]|nr:mechanosensitive ion channel family protein [Candidatus Nitrosotalea sp.]
RVYGKSMTPMSLRDDCGLRRRFSPLLIPAAFVLVCTTGGSAAAQGLPGLPLPSASALALPSDVRQEGPYVTASIYLDGSALFRIATPANGTNQMSVEARAQFIEAALGELVAWRDEQAQRSGTAYDPKTLRVGALAQNLVRDFLNGFLALVEDQYVVGDYVIIGDRSGLVEHMSLRVMQLRDAAGNLVTIPRSVVTQVVNCSRNWSRGDFRIAIDAGADAKRATEVLWRVVTELASDSHWRPAIVEPMEWVGVDAVSSAGIVLRASVKSAPLRQFEVRRELNARMVEALRRAGIALGNKDAYAA